VTPRWKRRTLGAWPSLAFWLAFAVVVWLDRRAGIATQRAEVFSFLLSAFAFIADAAEFIISGIEVGLTTAVTWLISAVGWVVVQIGNIVVSTGSIFAKTWDALKGLWSDVIEPFVEAVENVVERVYGWLKDLLAPLFQWAQAVRDELLAIYKTFIKPILDGLSIARGILDILAKLHVPFAAALDQYATELQGWITKAYLDVLGKVNLVLNTLNGLFTFDGLLQRFVLIRSIQRDVVFVQRAMLNPMNKPLSDFDQARSNARWQPQGGAELQSALADYIDGGENDTGAAVDAAVQSAVDYWNNFDDSEAA
jgi:hypothetical protein